MIRPTFVALLSLAAAAPALAQQPAAPQPAVRIQPGVPDTSPFRPLALSAASAYRTGAGTPGPLYWQQRADYTIRASLDTATLSVHGAETIRYTNNSPDTLRYVWMQLDQNQSAPGNKFAQLAPPFGAMGARRGAAAAARQGPPFVGGYMLERVAVLRAPRRGARPAPTPLAYRINTTMMRVDLDRPLPPKGVVDLDLAWHYMVPRMGRTGREQFPEGWLYEIAQWYPRLAVYDDVKGWNTDQYLGSGEFYLEYGDFDFTITAPADYTVTATGVLQNPTQVLTATQRRRLALALHSDTTIHIIAPDEVGTPALLPPGTGATRSWHYRATNVRDVSWAAAPNFLWDASGWDGVLIQALYPPVALPLWSQAADMARATIKYHSRWYHYPYPTAIDVNGPVGGMEYPMIVFCSERRDEKALYFVQTHELGHQWFPMTVGSNERLYGWMDEGFNTFIDYFSFHDRYPDDTTIASQPGRALNWLGLTPAWVQYITHYPGVEQPIMTPQDRSAPGLGGALAYGKPAVGLHFLRNEVVDSTAFDQAFREYIRRWAFRHPTPPDFFRTMNDALGEDLSWFWRSWFYRSDHLDQAVDSVVQPDTGAPVLARIFFSNKAKMVAPLDLRVTLANGATEHAKLPVQAWYRGSPFVWVHRWPARVVRVEIDPRGVYPDVDRGNNVWEAMK
jgi:hypothetical protein